MRGLACVVVAGCGFSAQSHPLDAQHDGANVDQNDAPILNDAAIDTLTVTCPVTYDLEFGGHSYRKTALSTDYAGVVGDCHDGSGYVVAIDSTEEDTWVKNQFGSNGYIWIGLHYDGPMGYRWDNHVKLGTFNNFSGGTVPATPTDPCVDKALSPASGGAWTPFACTQLHQGMCECDGP